MEQWKSRGEKKTVFFLVCVFDKPASWHQCFASLLASTFCQLAGLNYCGLNLFHVWYENPNFMQLKSQNESSRS